MFSSRRIAVTEFSLNKAYDELGIAIEDNLVNKAMPNLILDNPVNQIFFMVQDKIMHDLRIYDEAVRDM